MICQNCQKENNNDAKFCCFCGQDAKEIKEGGSVDLYFQKRDNSCQVCGAYAPIKYVEFNQNVGMLVMREYKEVKGKLCRNCINKTFWRFTLITLAVGWLGAISLLVAPYFIVSNIIYYIGSLGLPYPNERN